MKKGENPFLLPRRIQHRAQVNQAGLLLLLHLSVDFFLFSLSLPVCEPAKMFYSKALGPPTFSFVWWSTPSSSSSKVRFSLLKGKIPYNLSNRFIGFLHVIYPQKIWKKCTRFFFLFCRHICASRILGDKSEILTLLINFQNSEKNLLSDTDVDTSGAENPIPRVTTLPTRRSDGKEESTKVWLFLLTKSIMKELSKPFFFFFFLFFSGARTLTRATWTQSVGPSSLFLKTRGQAKIGRFKSKDTFTKKGFWIRFLFLSCAHSIAIC